MTDTHGNTPGGPVPPTSGDEHAQHAAQTGQQPYYQQSYQQPYQAQHTPGQVTVEKKSHGLRTFLLAFAGAALACVIGLGGFGIWQAATGADKGGGSDSGSSTQLGSQNSGSINATDAESDQTLAEAVAQKALPSVAAIDVYANQSNMGGMYGFGGGSNSGSGSCNQQAGTGKNIIRPPFLAPAQTNGNLNSGPHTDQIGQREVNDDKRHGKIEGGEGGLP